MFYGHKEKGTTCRYSPCLKMVLHIELAWEIGLISTVP